MAEPTPPTDGAPVPSEDTETGRAKHAAPPEQDGAAQGGAEQGGAVDRPAVARAATGPDAARDATDRPTASAPPPAAGSPGTAVPARPDGTAERDDRGAEPDGSRNDALDARSDAAAARADAATARTEAAETRSDAADARTERLDRSEDRTAVLPADERAEDGDRTAVLPAERADDATPPPPAPRQAPTPMPPAASPPPPRLRSNRLVGTAWVLLAALVFEVVYLAAFALVVLVVAGQGAVAAGVRALISSPFAWMPVLLFALFYELTVLLLNRAGRFAYVLTSLIVAAIVYVLSAVLILALQAGGISNENNLGRALVDPRIVLIPLVAREVMLWTGLAIGARGRRVRKRNREAQEAYERDRFASSVRESDAGARA